MRTIYCLLPLIAVGFVAIGAEGGMPLGRKYLSYRSFNNEFETTAKFAKMGYRTRCFMAGNTANSLGRPYCEYPPIWNGVKDYDFSAFDKQVADLTSASPEADLICIVDLNTPPWLARRLSADSFSDLTHLVADPRWFEYTDVWLKDFLEYAERKHGERIVAYLLSGGGTSEWYEWDFGRSSEMKNAAWRKWCAERSLDHGRAVPDAPSLMEASFEGVIYDPATEKKKIDYWRFHNSLPSKAVLHFAEITRRIVARRKEIGVFFGYYHVRDGLQVSFGHLDYLKVFDSPDIDFIVAPGLYKERECGGGSGTQTVIGSAHLRGKRFLHEIDFWPHGLKAPWGSSKTYFKTLADDIAGNMREAAFALASNASLWWFDQLGGFYADQMLRERISSFGGALCEIGRADPMSVADVLLVADPESFYYVNEDSPRAVSFGQAFYRALNRSGAVHDVYSFDDLPKVDLSRYRLVCMPCTFLITPVRAKFLREHICCDGRTLLWTFAPGVTDGKRLDAGFVEEWAGVPYATSGVSSLNRGTWRSVYAQDPALFTPDVLHRICRDAGAHVYLDTPASVFANERVLAVHLKDGGCRKVKLPRRAKKVKNLLSGKDIALETDAFDVEFSSPDTIIMGVEY